MPIGWYFSVADWKDPDCRNPSTNEVFAVRVEQQVRELLTNYGKISVLWIDYEGSPSPIHPKRVYDLARKLQPEIIINNRLEPFNTDESHSRVGPYADYATPEGFVAGYGKVPWETCTTMGRQWAWKFGDSPRSLKESVHTLLRCVGGNGNLLFNIGPDSTGVFPENFVQRTHEMGKWLMNNAAAIYQTQAGIYTPSANYVSTQTGNQLFVHLLSDSAEGLKLPPIPAKIETAALMNGEKVMFTQNSRGVNISFPKARRDSIATIVKLTLDRPAAAVKKTIPFSTTESLAYGKNVSASSSVGEFLHDPTAAFDDNSKTFWKMGRRSDINFDKLYGKTIHYRSEAAYELFQNKGWLEVDLGKPQTVGQIRLEESVFFDSKIKQFEVQYESNGKWLSVVSDNEMGSWSKDISPVISQKFRLVINDSFGYCGVAEFQVFPPKIDNFQVFVKALEKLDNY
jgi:alpha-L-fucosidase